MTKFEFDADTMKYQGEGANQRVFLADRDIGGVAELYVDHSRYLEVRALLVAAPDLLAAAMAMMEFHEAGDCQGSEQTGAYQSLEMRQAFAGLEAAIAKAEGIKAAVDGRRA